MLTCGEAVIQMRLIDADKLIVAMMDAGVESIQTNDLSEIQQIVEAAPAVDAAPVVHARWILTTSRDDIDKPERYSWNCSHCGYRRKSGESIEIRMREPKGAFCERCGARMDGGEQAETD